MQCLKNCIHLHIMPNLELTQAYVVHWSLRLHPHLYLGWMAHTAGQSSGSRRSRQIEAAVTDSLFPDRGFRQLALSCQALLFSSPKCFRTGLLWEFKDAKQGHGTLRGWFSIHLSPTIEELLRITISQEDRLLLTSLPGSLLCYSLGSDYLSIWI